MKKLIISLMLALVLTLVPASTVFAETSQDVTVDATPAYISIANAPGTWVINGISGSGKIDKNTTYYSNPLGDTTSPSATVAVGECRFTITNSSSVITNITANFPNFTGGDAMTNSNTGSAGVGTFGAYGYYSGMLYTSKVIMKNAGSDPLKSNLAATTDLPWGIELTTQTDDWTSGTQMSSTVTVTATQA